MAAARILEEDPDLCERIAADEQPGAIAAAVARVDRLDLGVWAEAPREDNRQDGYGSLVLEGMLARRVTLGRFDCTELLGAGDLLRPWTFDTGVTASIPSKATWSVVEPVRLALLDRQFALAVAPWPEVSAALMDRMVQRARWLAFQLAVCHVVRVDTRLLLMMWHFADRWGRMTPEGARVRIPVTHGVLASIVGARRPSVTTSLGRLQEEGRVERLGDGEWLLLGEPPSDFAQLGAASYAGTD